MATNAAPLIISAAHLNRTRKDNPNIVILDTTWFMPNSPRDAYKEFLNKRIEDAKFLDLDLIAEDPTSDVKPKFPHMLPSSDAFSKACGKLGIQQNSHVVLYDTHGVFSAPRALWMFRAFGHTNSSVLDGGLPEWEDNGLPLLQTEPTEVPQTHYPPPQLDTAVVKSYEQVASNACLKPEISEIVLDARSPGRFSGSDPEPRPQLSSGHMPNSFNVPFGAFLQKKTAGNTTYTSFLSPADIRKALVYAVGQERATAIVAGERSVITSCGSGMSAGILWLGLRLLSTNTKIGLYDESWTGYASRESSTILKS